MSEYEFDPVTGTMKRMVDKVDDGVARNIDAVTSSPSTSVPLISAGDGQRHLRSLRAKPPVNPVSEKTYTEADRKTMQVVDKDSGTPLFLISGIDLDVSFNLSAIKSVADVEQCLNGISKLFRGIIMDLIVSKKE